MDWTAGLEYWTGLLDWTTGLRGRVIFHLLHMRITNLMHGQRMRALRLFIFLVVLQWKWTVNRHRSESVSDLTTMEELEGACRSCPIVIADSTVVIADSPASRSPVKVAVNAREYR